MYIKGKISYSPIGIDIGSRSIQALQLACDNSKLSLQDADYEMLGDIDDYTRTGEISEKISRILQRCHFRGKTIITRMPSALVNIMPLKVEVKEGLPVEDLILKEAKEYIPYPIEEAVIDYIPVNSSTGSKDEKRLLLIFARRKDVIAYFNMFKKLGLKVLIMDVGPNAINRVLKHFKDPEDQQIMTLNIGDTFSFSMVIHKNSILIDRKINWGEDHLIRKIVNRLDMSPSMARSILYRYGIDTTRIAEIDMDEASMTLKERAIPPYLFEIIYPALEDLNREMEKMFIYISSEMKGAMVDSIYLFGKGALFNHLNTYIARSTGIKVKVLQPEDIFTDIKDLKPVLRENFSLFIISIGLALRGMSWSTN